MSEQLAKQLFDFFLQRFQIYGLTDFITFSIPTANKNNQLFADQSSPDYSSSEQALLNLVRQSETGQGALPALYQLLNSATEYLTVISDIPGGFERRISALFRNTEMDEDSAAQVRLDALTAAAVEELPIKGIIRLIHALRFAETSLELPDDAFLDRFDAHLNDSQ